MNLTNYKQLFQCESVGSIGSHGIKIEVAIHSRNKDVPEIDMVKLSQTEGVYKARDLLEFEVMKAIYANDPEEKERARIEREQLTQHCIGESPIFIEELPNGYCSRGCCVHLPWFKITTSVGPIIIGWRKRVINIDWSQTKGTKTAEELFPKEDVTKDTRGIHAWSLEKARAYTDAIISGQPLK